MNNRYLLKISMFSKQIIVNDILGRNCIIKRNSHMTCFQIFLQDPISNSFVQIFPCLVCRFNLMTKFIVDDFYDLDHSYKINKGKGLKLFFC